ncbi:hypothetical protein KGF86_18000, partial [Ornithinibacillus massiliensis]
TESSRHPPATFREKSNNSKRQGRNTTRFSPLPYFLGLMGQPHYYIIYILAIGMKKEVIC